MIFFRFANMGSNGSEIFKTLLLLQIAAKSLKLVLNFPPNGPHKNRSGIFEILSCWFLKIFFENLKFIIVAYGEIKTSIIWKMSDRRAKLSEIWDSWVVL